MPSDSSDAQGMSIVSKAAPSHFPNQATRDAQPITVA